MNRMPFKNFDLQLFANGNVVTNATRAAVSAYLVGLSLYLGLGTGTTTPANADTALATELTTAALGGTATYARPAMTNSQQTTNVANDTAQSVATYTNPTTAANTVAVTEVGTFSAATAGTMYFHSVFSAINLAPGFGLQATNQIVFA
jgi:hypothetical protein